MKRVISFRVGDQKSPKFDVTNQKWVPETEIRIQFTNSVGNFKSPGFHVARIVVQFIRIDVAVGDPIGFSERVFREESVVINGDDATLAAACASTDEETSEHIAHTLFWRHVVKPSVDDTDHWLRRYAPEYWDWIAKVVLSERERTCLEVHSE